MKKLIAFIVLLFVNVTYSQYTMVIGTNDAGVQTIIPAGNIDQITFYPACSGTPSVTYEGKVYATVYIGSQCWLAENINVGTMINNISGGASSNGTQTNNNTIEKYCYSNNSSNCDTYGGLYQWAEAVAYINGVSNASGTPPAGNTQGICPAGWHIPTRTEFETLSSVVGDHSNALKAIGQGTGSGTGTNTSGFSALLAGSHHFNLAGNYFSDLGSIAEFWTSNAGSNNLAFTMYLEVDTDNVNERYYYKTTGYSVRCLKD